MICLIRKTIWGPLVLGLYSTVVLANLCCVCRSRVPHSGHLLYFIVSELVYWDSVPRFLTIFLLNGLANFFVFAKKFDRKVRKLHVRVVVDYANMQIFLKIQRFLFYFYYCCWVCKHTQNLFLPDCSFKICEKPSQFFPKLSA